LICRIDEHGNTSWKPLDAGRGSAVAEAGSQRQVVVLISALLKRSQLSIKDRARHLKQKSAKTKPLD
jgi:hypothetical protein